MNRPALLAAFCLLGALGVVAAPYITQSRIPKSEATQLKEVSYQEQVAVSGELERIPNQVLRASNSGVVAAVHLNEGETVALGEEIITMDKQATAMKTLENSVSAQNMTLPEGFSLKDFPLTSDTGLSEPTAEAITAEAEGVVERVLVKPGDYLEPFQTIATLEGENSLQVSAKIPQNDAWKIKVGQEAIISEAGSQQTYVGVVESLEEEARSEYIGTSKETVVPAVIHLNSPVEGLKPGYSARIRVNINPPQRVSVLPYSAVAQEGEENFVYVFEGGKALKRTVTLGRDLPEGVEVLKGITAEDLVLTNTEGISEGGWVILEKSSADLQ